MRVTGAWLVGVGLMGPLGASGHVEAQAVAFSPTVGSLMDGVSLSATPAVSADRRYVRLSVGPMFQTVDGFQVIGVPGAVSGGNGGGLRSVGVVSGMNGPIGPAFPDGQPGMASSTGQFGYDFSGSGYVDPYVEDFGAWRPAPRRGKSTRGKATAAKKATPRPAVAASKKP